MKKFMVLILALSMTLAVSGCTQSSSGKDLPVASQKVESKPDPDSSVPDKLTPPETKRDSSVVIPDKLTPATTEAQDFASGDHSYYKFTSSAEKYDSAEKKRYYYKGEIADDGVKRTIFHGLARIINSSEIQPKGEQTVTGGANALITFTGKSGEEYKLCEGLLIQHPDEEGGDAIFIFRMPHSTIYLGAGYEAMQDLKNAIRDGVMTSKNLVKTSSLNNTEPEQKELKPKDIAYIRVYSNYAEGRVEKGFYLTVNGEYHTFDYSKIDPKENKQASETHEQWLINLICEQSPYDMKQVSLQTRYIKQALAYAAKTDPDAKVTVTHKMCDYGQKTSYAVVDGKAIMLYSYGDNQRIVEDDNAKKAEELFGKALTDSLQAE